MNLRNIFLTLSLVSLPLFAQQKDVAVKDGKYKATWESLSTWECPEWFRDAKFGIWAHWGPQCQAESGDWYARGMYQKDSWQNKHHVATYGDPKDYGLKELCRDWKAERWQPDSLVRLYKEAGARYFFTLGQHHDNFDLWDSPYQEWNSVRIGPKRDIVRGWADACKKYHIPLGISFHGSHAWTWLEESQYYDGNLTKEDGRGQWWEGLDPQELYAQRHPMSEGNHHGGGPQWEWQNGASQPSQAYKQKFQNRVLECINTFHPDVIYFDDTVLPFWGCDEQVGLNILAHYYNSARQRKGNADVVATGKILKEEHKQALMWDVERGVPDRSQPLPWQTCTCIGSWHYDRGIYNRGHYKSAATVIRMLVDVISKNGNLLLSVPVRADGTIDEKERAVVNDIKAWMDINSESIYGTRPWTTFGEGPLAEGSKPLNAQGFNEGFKYSAQDVRYVSKGKKTVFATIMVWPEAGDFTFKALSSKAGRVKGVSLLGYGRLPYTQDAQGLHVTLPAQHPNDIAPALKISLTPAKK